MSIGLLFSGQGAQKVGMGRSFYDNSPVARALYDEADAILGWKLSDVCFNGPEEKLTETRVCQPTLYVMGYAVFATLKEAGKLSGLKTALGLSLGELTALAAAGAFDFATGLKIVAERGRLMQEACEATEGGMASLIGGSPEAVEALCARHDIDIGNFNCPGQIVISGAVDRIEAAVEEAKAGGTFKRVIPLKVAGAYHSRLMESARSRFEAFLADVEVREPEITVFTNTTGHPVKTPEAIKAALVRQVVSSVRWEECQRHAGELGVDQFYECGPGGVLAGLARRIDRDLPVSSLAEFDDLPLG